MSIRVFGYLRVSGVSQLDGDGLPRQRIAIEAYAQSHDLEIVEVFEERGISGTKDLEHRPALQELYSRIVESGVKHIIIEKLDRIARDLLVQETIMCDLKKKGIELISTMEPDLCGDEPSRKLVRQIFGAIAEYDRALITLKLNGARKRIRDAGGKAEGVYPYGSDPKRPEEAETLALMRSIRDGGDTYERVAERLNVLGWTGRHGGEWKTATVAKILRRHP